MPNFVVVLIFLIAVGIGPFAGVLSLALGTVGMFGKLFADTIEQVDAASLEGVSAAGAARLQLVRYGVLPQVIPSFVATLFYSFDVNLRAAIAFGVFGAGGVGFELSLASHVLRFRDMLAYTILIIVLITAMEKVSDRLRSGLLSTSLQ
jgi:phosphonate transport system permease protein